MATHPRLLRVESCEDRLAPATLTMIQGYHPIYGSYYTGQTRADLSAHSQSSFSSRDHGATTFYIPRSEWFVVTSGNGRGAFTDVIVWRGNWNTMFRFSAATSPTPPVTNNPSPPETATPSSGGTARPATHTPTATTNSGQDYVTDRSATSANANVSIPVGRSGGPAADGSTTVDDEAEQVSRAVAPNPPPVAFESRPDFGHLSVPVLSAAEFTEIVLPVVPEAPQSEEPPLAQEDPPAVPESSPSSTPVPVLTSSEPLAGLLPFNLPAIESGVRGVLDRVAGLEQAWSESPAGTEDYLWLAAASLVAGGVAQAAWTRRTRPADPRTLGLDSVLTRWGEKYVG